MSHRRRSGAGGRSAPRPRNPSPPPPPVPPAPSPAPGSSGGGDRVSVSGKLANNASQSINALPTIPKSKSVVASNTNKIYVFWDIENCPVSKKLKGKGNLISSNLQSRLVADGNLGPLSIIAIGDIQNNCNQKVIQALQSTGVRMHSVFIKDSKKKNLSKDQSKDQSDLRIMTDMILWANENPPPAIIVLISGDGDFTDVVAELVRLKYKVILIHPENASVKLKGVSPIKWHWETILNP